MVNSDGLMERQLLENQTLTCGWDGLWYPNETVNKIRKKHFLKK